MWHVMLKDNVPSELVSKIIRRYLNSCIFLTRHPARFPDLFYILTNLLRICVTSKVNQACCHVTTYNWAYFKSNVVTFDKASFQNIILVLHEAYLHNCVVIIAVLKIQLCYVNNKKASFETNCYS